MARGATDQTRAGQTEADPTESDPGGNPAPATDTRPDPKERVRVRRSRFVSFFIEDDQKLDLSAFLRGKVTMLEASRLAAFSAVSGERFPLESSDVAGLLSIPTKTWTPVAEILASSRLNAERLEALVDAGVLLSDGDGRVDTLHRQRDETFERLQWSPSAALFHFTTQREEAERPADPVDVGILSDQAEENARKVVELRGPPPPAIGSRGGDLIALPSGDAGPGRPFYQVLRDRRTVRGFDVEVPLSREHLATLLRWVFGAQGIARLAPEVELLHKTSPSGGSLHPIDVYPLILRAEGCEPGFYHYDPLNHGLRPVAPLAIEDARSLAVQACRNQLYAGDAQVLFILTARWGRNYWKYRKSSRTYCVILKDAGHLSQTFYLTAAELGLGAFYTGAILAELLERILGLRPEEEGVLGICGCGAPGSKGDLSLPFEPLESGC